MSLETLLVSISLLLIVSIIASKTSSRIGIPSLLIFFVIGILLGSEGVAGIYFKDPQIAQYVGIVALVFILFSSGLETEWRMVKPVLYEGIALSTIGVLITALILSLFAVFVLKFTFLEGLLLGSIVSSTDAAAVFSVLRSRKVGLSGRLIPLLELSITNCDRCKSFGSIL